MKSKYIEKCFVQYSKSFAIGLDGGRHKAGVDAHGPTLLPHGSEVGIEPRTGLISLVQCNASLVNTTHIYSIALSDSQGNLSTLLVPPYSR